MILFSGLSPTGVTYDKKDLPEETQRWIDNGGYCCCQDKSECPVIDSGIRQDSLVEESLDTRITTLDISVSTIIHPYFLC